MRSIYKGASLLKAMDCDGKGISKGGLVVFIFLCRTERSACLERFQGGVAESRLLMYP